MKRVIFLLAALSPVPAAPSDLEAGDCGPVTLMQGRPLHSASAPAPARVQARPVAVPSLQLRFRDRQTGRPPASVELSVCYDWRWFQYPYPETLFGAWEISYECRRCRLDSEGAVTVAAHEVTPRGWYDGWLRFGREPRFEGVRLGLNHRGYHQSLPHLTGKTLQRLREKGVDATRIESADFEVTVSSSAAHPPSQSP